MSAGYVYVLAFTNGTVKVGRTQDKGQRMTAHKSAARKFGLTVTDEWVSPLHAEWRANEDALKNIAAGMGGTAHTREYFSGVDFAAVVTEAKRLTYTPPPPPRTRVRREPEPDALAHEGGIKDAAAFRPPGFGRYAEKQRIAEIEAQREAEICWMLHMYRKCDYTPDTLRNFAGAERRPGMKTVLMDFAEAMEAQLRFEAVIDRFLDRAQVT